MIEIRWHGRGGQGAWTASNILAFAAVREGKYVQSFPAFGPERMGAPILAFTRISDEPIEIHSMVYTPDIVVVLDPTLIGSTNVLEGLKEGGKVVVNWSGNPKDLLKMLGGRGDYRVYMTPATEIAVDVLGRGITNTAMVGALLKAEPLVSIDEVLRAVKERFPGTLGEKNVLVVRRAYESTVEVQR